MKINPPKSLTAIVHVKFDCKETEKKLPDESQVEIIGRILDQAAELDPELQEMLVKFADYLSGLGQKE